MISRHQSANLHRNVTESLFSDSAAVSSQVTENAVHHHAAFGCCGANAPVNSTLHAVAAAITARLVCSVIKKPPSVIWCPQYARKAGLLYGFG